MARDPRKNSAFDSGMRGREKPKVSESHGKTKGAEEASRKGGEHKQGANSVVGDPDGVTHTDPAYTSGMRGMEKPKQKSASGDANMFAEDGSTMGGESKQGPNTIVGHPKGHDDAASGQRHGVSESSMRNSGKDAYSMGNNGNAVNSSEAAAAGHDPSGEGILGEEDDTHINIRVPKSSIRKKAAGLQAS